MRILVTGAGGFAGRHLINYLTHHESNAEIHGCVFRTNPDTLPDYVTYHRLDLRDETAVEHLVAHVAPDQVYHLAAQASVPQSFTNPWDTFEVNVRGQLNLLTVLHERQPHPRVLIASSSEVYGLIHPDDVPIREDVPLHPGNPYAVSKVAQDALAYQIFQSHGLPIVRARAFNHIGPGQSENYVAAAFAAQIARIEVGEQEPVIRVGDLTAERDFADVRDVVRAYHLILKQGDAGEVYNIATGKAVTIQYLLDQLLALSTIADISVEVDPLRLRPSRVPILRGDYSALRLATGWEPSFSFEESLVDILDDFRQRVRQ